MIPTLSSEVLTRLQGRTLATAESLTGGGIGAVLTGVPGSSAVYKGGIISYTNQIKHTLLGVPEEILDAFGAVSEPTAKAMAEGARRVLQSDLALSVTGLAGPGGDEYGNPVGTVFIGCTDGSSTTVKHCLFSGSREQIRQQTIETALKLVLEYTL